MCVLSVGIFLKKLWEQFGAHMARCIDSLNMPVKVATGFAGEAEFLSVTSSMAYPQN